MRWMKLPKLQWYSFLFSMPLVGLAMNLIFFDNRLWADVNIWLVSFPVICILGFIPWYLHFRYSKFVESKYPAISQSKNRILVKALSLLIIMPPSIMLLIIFYNGLHILGYQFKVSHLYKALLVGLSINLIFETLFEADYVLGKYRESLGEKETIRQLSVAQEFDALKSQVNPHFLFNCFNTLSSLISEDRQKAEVFLNELSKVYRYLLRNNEAGVSTVDNELKFIKSYYKLLQTRHGEAVQLNMQIDKRYDSYLLPSLSLQLLVENVVKHNVLSKNKPLVIDIFTTAGNKMVVNNNLQRRTVKAASNKVGLDNIKAKYDLLKQPGFQVIEDEKNFTVVLPLIWKGNTINHGVG